MSDSRSNRYRSNDYSSGPIHDVDLSPDSRVSGSSHSHSRNPLTRLDMWDKHEMLEIIALECSILEISDSEKGLRQICDAIARACRSHLTSRQQKMTGQDVLDCYLWMKGHEDEDENPINLGRQRVKPSPGAYKAIHAVLWQGLVKRVFRITVTP